MRMYVPQTAVFAMAFFFAYCPDIDTAEGVSTDGGNGADKQSIIDYLPRTAPTSASKTSDFDGWCMWIVCSGING